MKSKYFSNDFENKSGIFLYRDSQWLKPLSVLGSRSALSLLAVIDWLKNRIS